MASSSISGKGRGGGDAQTPHALPMDGERIVTDQIGALPVSTQEIHILLDALGPELAQLFEEAKR
jgi:hypothetical protein